MKRFFRALKSGWIAFGNFLGKIMSTIILFILYFLVVGPISIFSWIFRKDHLGMKRQKGARTFWKMYEAKEPTLENLKKQW